MMRNRKIQEVLKSVQCRNLMKVRAVMMMMTKQEKQVSHLEDELENQQQRHEDFIEKKKKQLFNYSKQRLNTVKKK